MSEQLRYADRVCETVGCEGTEGRDRRVYLQARPSTWFARTGAPSSDCGEIQGVRAKRRLETLEIPWVRNTEIAAHSTKTIRDNKGDGRKLIPNSESVDIHRHDITKHGGTSCRSFADFNGITGDLSEMQDD